LITILYDIGFLFHLIEWFNLDDDDERKEGLKVFNFERQVRLDTNGSIIKLDLTGGFREKGKQYQCCLPSSIGRFQKLECIHLHNCTVITKKLENLPSLRTLVLSGCPQELFDTISEEMRLLSISTLQIFGNKFGSLSKLFHLFSDSHGRKQTEEFPRIFQDSTQSSGLRISLTEAVAHRNGWNEIDLERIIFEILPLYPKIRKLDFSFNDAKSLRSILDRIDRLEREYKMPSSSNSTMAIMPKEYRLSRLHLLSNPVWKHYDAFRDEREKDPNGKDGLLTLLDKFTRISNIGPDEYGVVMGKEIAIDPDLEYILRINHVGGKYLTMLDGGTIVRKPIINCSRLQDSMEVYNDGCGTSDEHKKKARCATGLFHLIRNMYVYQWRGEKVYLLAPSSNVYIPSTTSSLLMTSSFISRNNNSLMMPARTMHRLTTNNTGPNSNVYSSDNNGSSKRTDCFRGASLLTKR
jgi:hypothetical protein